MSSHFKNTGWRTIYSQDADASTSELIFKTQKEAAMWVLSSLFSNPKILYLEEDFPKDSDAYRYNASLAKLLPRFIHDLELDPEGLRVRTRYISRERLSNTLAYNSWKPLADAGLTVAGPIGKDSFVITAAYGQPPMSYEEILDKLASLAPAVAQAAELPGSVASR